MDQDNFGDLLEGLHVRGQGTCATSLALLKFCYLKCKRMSMIDLTLFIVNSLGGISAPEPKHLF